MQSKDKAERINAKYFNKTSEMSEGMVGTPVLPTRRAQVQV
jgi:hypothetical protein